MLIIIFLTPKSLINFIHCSSNVDLLIFRSGLGSLKVKGCNRFPKPAHKMPLMRISGMTGLALTTLSTGRGRVASQ